MKETHPSFEPHIEDKDRELQMILRVALAHAYKLEKGPLSDLELSSLSSHDLYEALSASPIDPKTFSELSENYPEYYHRAHIASGIAVVERMENREREVYEQASEEKKMKKEFNLHMGLLYELFTTFQIEQNYMLGKRVRARRTSAYDDREGVDIIALFPNEDSQQRGRLSSSDPSLKPEEPRVLGMDLSISYGHIQAKIAKNIDLIHRGTLGKIHYGQFTDDEERLVYKGPLEGVPIVIVGVNPGKFIDGLSLWAKGKHKELSHDITSSLMQKEIEMQLTAYALYAQTLVRYIPFFEKCASNLPYEDLHLFNEWKENIIEIPHRYEHILEGLSPVLEEKVPAEEILNDPFFTLMKQTLDDLVAQPITEATFQSILDELRKADTINTIRQNRQNASGKERENAAREAPAAPLTPRVYDAAPLPQIAKDENPTEATYQKAVEGFERMRHAQEERAKENRERQLERQKQVAARVALIAEESKSATPAKEKFLQQIEIPALPEGKQAEAVKTEGDKTSRLRDFFSKVKTALIKGSTKPS